ncbi:MAG: sugar ABC transporter ATP-binding protein [Sneathiellaceae bacterium]
MTPDLNPVRTAPAHAGAAPGGSVPPESAALAIHGLSKRFGGALALDAVDLDIAEGEVHGLLGQNGSGKSTLIKILAGFHAPEPGARVTLHGADVPLPIPPGAARRMGLAFVHQHLAMLPSLSVLENLRLWRFSTERRWRIDWRREQAQARETFARFGLDIDPRARLADLSQVERALVAIVRAFEDLRAGNASGTARGILILDEPTPFLPSAGVDQLFSLVRDVVREGASVIFVSHDVDEIMEITDRATVLRDGKVAGTLETAQSSADDFVEMIIGRKVELFQAWPHDAAAEPVTVRVEGLSGGMVKDLSLDLHRGEILGLTGLLGSGFDELPYLLYGARPVAAGRLDLPSGSFDLRRMAPPAAIAAGIALLPSDRLFAAGVGSLSVADNVTLPVLGEFLSGLGLDWGGIRGRARDLGDRYDVRPNRADLLLSALSGGNQQKVLMAKWLQTDPVLLLLDEPTQGVDVGARQRLFQALGEAAQGGTTIVVASTDAEQLAQICDRVLVFARGRIVQELTGGQVTKEIITEQCLRSIGVEAIRTKEAARA